MTCDRDRTTMPGAESHVMGNYRVWFGGQRSAIAVLTPSYFWGGDRKCLYFIVCPKGGHPLCNFGVCDWLTCGDIYRGQ